MATEKIWGMPCDRSVKAVTKALNEIRGIKDVQVSLARGEATFDEEEPVAMDIVKAQIAKAGYEAAC